MSSTRWALRKVPEITFYFWVVQVLTTAMGEATSDFMVQAIDSVVAVALGALGFAVAQVSLDSESRAP